jgi:hypothetical protein
LNQLEQIKKFTPIVADTGDFETIREFKPKDATTNPSLIYAATQKENYNHFLEEVLASRRKSGLSGAAQIDDIIDHLLVKFGCAILEIVPGRVSTETDARFSFDVEGSIKKARRFGETLRGTGDWARARAHQDCFHVGRNSRGRATAKGRHQVHVALDLAANIKSDRLSSAANAMAMQPVCSSLQGVRKLAAPLQGQSEGCGAAHVIRE